jgi:hypothetical protein
VAVGDGARLPRDPFRHERAGVVVLVEGVELVGPEATHRVARDGDVFERDHALERVEAVLVLGRRVLLFEPGAQVHAVAVRAAVEIPARHLREEFLRARAHIGNA